MRAVRKILKDIDAVIFDLDGTLADSMWVWSEIDREFFRSRGISLPESLDREIEGLGFTETAEFFVARFDLKESAEDLKQLWNEEAEEKYREEVPLKPGVPEFLEALRDLDLSMGLATSNSFLLADTFLRAKGIRPYIDVVTTVCDVNSGKPAPDVYLATAQKLGVSPPRCLVFEDIPMGILAGKNAGMRVCAVEDAYSAAQRKKKRRLADYYINDFRDLFV